MRSVNLTTPRFRYPVLLCDQGWRHTTGMDSQILLPLLRTEAEFPTLMNLARRRHDAFRASSFQKSCSDTKKAMEESLVSTKASKEELWMKSFKGLRRALRACVRSDILIDAEEIT